jgi:glucosamine--fructose-6-phosphate aminotransferase (isomerizing)
MCGIIAYLGQDVYHHILEGLEQLQNRGYDSAGILTYIQKEWVLHKHASSDCHSAMEKLKEYDQENRSYGIGIGHTRWATHGQKTDVNAHPHCDDKNEFGLVHNGIIENYDKIRKFLEKDGYKFKSQTDTEVIVGLLSYYYEKTKNVEESIKLTISELEGTYALCIVTKYSPDTLYCIRKGSPLLVGLYSNYVIIASEVSGFCNKINKYIILDNNDLCILKLNSLSDHNKIQIQYSNTYSYMDIKKEFHAITPEPYLHWTLKEIMEQPESILRCICYGSRLSRSIEEQYGSNQFIVQDENKNKIRTENFDRRKIKLGGLENIYDKISDVKHLIILGCGTSHFAGASVVSLFKKYTHFESVNAYDASEFYDYHIPKTGKTCSIFISQSGETKDLYDKIELMKSRNIVRLGVINVVDSYIAREMDAGVYLHIGREVGVASTKAFTSQVLCLTMIMLWFLENRNPDHPILDEYIEAILSLPNDITISIEKNHQLCKEIATSLIDKEHLFILSKDQNLFYSHEGSLKLKEIGYIHSEAYSSAALKHGPYALIVKDTPVILLCPRDEHFSKHQSIKEEILCRGGNVIGISNVDLDSKYHRKIVIPDNKYFFGILSCIMLQLISYELSLAKNINPDTPRNLAKVVTVD